MNNRIWVILFFFPLFSQLKAQVYQVRGSVCATNDTICFANVALYNMSKKMITGISTTPQGRFILKNIAKGNYTLIVSSVGYKSDTLNILNLVKDLDVGIIKLKEQHVELSGVTITANAIKSFASKDNIILPNSIKSKSQTGLSAIGQLPQFRENPLTNTLQTVDMQAVKILINGMNSTEKDLMTLLPKDILKIEYYTQPPARYANLGVGAVINVITITSKTTGFDFMINTTNSFTTGYGTNILNAKYYDSINQVSFRYFIDYRNLNDNRINQNFEYRIKGVDYKNVYEGLPSSYRGTYKIFETKYIRNKKDNYNFSATVNYRYNPGNEKYEQKTSVIYGNQAAMEGIATKDLKSNYNAFSADLYFLKKLPNNQEFITNVVGTFYTSTSTNILTRTLTNNAKDNYSYVNDIDNQSASAILEALYNKNFKRNSFTIGVRYFYKQLEQTYNSSSKSNLAQQIAYLYSSSSGNLNQVNYSLELGIEYAANTYKNETNNNTSYITPKPSISLNYSINKSSSLRLISAFYSTIPEISLLTTNPVYLNYQYISIGNPSLKPFYVLYNKLQYQLNIPKLYFSTAIKYTHGFNPYLPTFINRDSVMVKTIEVKKNINYYGYDANVSWKPYKWVTINPYFTIVYTKFIDNNGQAKDNLSNMFSINTTFSYKDLKLFLQYGSSYTNLQGDYITKNLYYYFGELSYNKKSMMISLQYIHKPNSGLSYSNCNVLKYKEETIWNNFNNLFAIKFIYSFSRGVKNSIRDNKKLDNKDDDSGLRDDAKAK